MDEHVRRPVPNQVPTGPGFRRLSTITSDSCGALSSGNQTLPDRLRRNLGSWHAEGQGFGGCPRGLWSVSTILPALTSPLHRSISLPELAGSARLLRWEQDGNTRAVHERSRPVPTDPARSRMTWSNDSAEQTHCTVVLADAGLQNQRAACRAAGGFDSRPPPPPAPTPDEVRSGHFLRAGGVGHSRRAMPTGRHVPCRRGAPPAITSRSQLPTRSRPVNGMPT
jgi:hypothetical protein